MHAILDYFMDMFRRGLETYYESESCLDLDEIFYDHHDELTYEED